MTSITTIEFKRMAGGVVIAIPGHEAKTIDIEKLADLEIGFISLYTLEIVKKKPKDNTENPPVSEKKKPAAAPKKKPETAPPAENPKPTDGGKTRPPKEFWDKYYPEALKYYMDRRYSDDEADEKARKDVAARWKYKQKPETKEKYETIREKREAKELPNRKPTKEDIEKAAAAKKKEGEEK